MVAIAVNQGMYNIVNNIFKDLEFIISHFKIKAIKVTLFTKFGKIVAPREIVD